MRRELHKLTTGVQVIAGLRALDQDSGLWDLSSYGSKGVFAGFWEFPSN